MAKKRILSLSKVYQLLEPGPVVMVSTAYQGEMNVMPLSWLMMIDFEPPIFAFVLSNRNYSFKLLQKSKECVVNIPTVSIAKKMIQCGNTSGRKIDKFQKFKLTPVTVTKVEAPLIDECYANIECKVINSTLANKYNIFILKGVKAWIDHSQKSPKTLHHEGRGVFIVAEKQIKLASAKK